MLGDGRLESLEKLLCRFAARKFNCRFVVVVWWFMGVSSCTENATMAWHRHGRQKHNKVRIN